MTAGAWQIVPPATTAQTPWVAFMQPFLLNSASQFRPGPPPALDSKQFATDFNEVKAYGAKNSTVRTPDQTATAYFWNANVINQYNQTFRDLGTARGMNLVDTVHLLAMGEMVAADAGISGAGSGQSLLWLRSWLSRAGGGGDSGSDTGHDAAYDDGDRQRPARDGGR